MSVKTANIMKVWRLATDTERAHGSVWYAEARKEIERRLPNLPIEVACGIVAALSPQTPWARNIVDAVRLVKTGDCWSTKLRKAKALQILAGGDPRTLLNSTSKNRGKERSFYECLLNPHNDSYACVDGHAYAVWAGERIETSKTPKFKHDSVASCYVGAAKRLGLKPNQVQATTWLAWRRIHKTRREIDRESSMFATF